MDKALPLDRFADAVADDLAGRLAASGLYPRRAGRWSIRGSRAISGPKASAPLFVLPQRWTDDFIPMTITPPPKELVRVMVSRSRAAHSRSRAARRAGRPRPRRRSRPVVEEVAFEYLKAGAATSSRSSGASTEDDRGRGREADLQAAAPGRFRDRPPLRRPRRGRPRSRCRRGWPGTKSPTHVRCPDGRACSARSASAPRPALRGAARGGLEEEEARVGKFPRVARRAPGLGACPRGDGAATAWLAADRYGRLVAARQLRSPRRRTAAPATQQSGMAVDVWSRDWWAGTRYAARPLQDRRPRRRDRRGGEGVGRWPGPRRGPPQARLPLRGQRTQLGNRGDLDGPRTLSGQGRRVSRRAPGGVGRGAVVGSIGGEGPSGAFAPSSRVRPIAVD